MLAVMHAIALGAKRWQARLTGSVENDHEGGHHKAKWTILSAETRDYFMVESPESSQCSA
jgi:hypothetical protein